MSSDFDALFILSPLSQAMTAQQRYTKLVVYLLLLLFFKLVAIERR